MYHYGWLCEELTLISEMYADAMDVNHCNSAKNSSPEISFLRLRWRQRSPRTLMCELTKQYGYIRQYLGRAAGQFATI